MAMYTVAYSVLAVLALIGLTNAAVIKRRSEWESPDSEKPAKYVRCLEMEIEGICHPAEQGCPTGTKQWPLRTFQSMVDCIAFIGDSYKCAGGPNPYCFTLPFMCPYGNNPTDEPFMNFDECCTMNGYEFYTKGGACFLNGHNN